VFKRDTQLKELQQAHKSLEADFRSLKLEWLETYDKINRLFHRLAQRDRWQRDKDRGEETNGDQQAPAPTRAIDVVSQRILARRRGLNAVPQPGVKPSTPTR